MHFSIFALASSEWGIGRFATDSFALIAFGLLLNFPIQLLKNKLQFKKIWTNENALSSLSSILN